VNNDDDGMRPSAGRDAQFAELQRTGAVSDAVSVGGRKLQEVVRASFLSNERGEEKQQKAGVAHTHSV
jgi:hypothetical protein